ncbi:hypothetical protein CLV24_11544 [Pontibacter ummariensis]|uniref:DUF6644 domain-containing protein n=1 Tax=Pontibacter ummariensis TaxID=1610492 RepID=A0A239HYR5_9BACT|nr:DUF6644 family protein [Pontibacter ummariensis]PRY10127.1 hypothetical protein CLV24_11544 [Pontibacter ummariensis]SNS86465.1 hypothetical protein SAMN06296052_11544 [Pontibacter ummariensis]
MAATLAGLLQGLEASALASAIRSSSWLYPFLEIVHILGIVLLVGAAFLFDMRLLGFSRKLPVPELACYLLPWSRRGLYLIVPSGILLFSTNAVALAADTMFQIKLIGLVAGGVNAGLFHRYIFPAAPEWRQGHTPPAAKAVAACSVVVWVLVITCGRLLAY